MDCSIIIVSYNVADLLLACLSSIYNQSGDLHLEVIVVDSASTDHTPARVTALFPQVIMLAQTTNTGFTRGNNIGLKVASGRTLFLLNPDTVLLGNALSHLMIYLEEHPSVGIVGPHTFNTDLTTQSTRRRFPTRITALFESTWLQPFAPPSVLDHFYMRDTSDTISQEADWVQGSAMLLRREVYEQIGGLDEGYIMFSEELDYCKRASDMGWRVGYDADAHIIHHGGASTDQVGALKHIYFQMSKLRYHRRVHGRLFADGLRVFLLCGYGWQWVLESLKRALGNKPLLRKERIRAYWQVIRSGLRSSG